MATDRSERAAGGQAPSAAEARELMADADRLASAVAAASRRYAGYLVGLGLVSVGWFVALAWMSGTDRGVLVSGLLFGAAVAVLSLTILPGARVSRSGFARRWVAAMLGWGFLFGLLLTIGLLGFRGQPGFWLATAPVVALPLGLGAAAEWRR